MNKLFTITFAAFYWLISMGVGLNLHFCGKEVADIALYAQGNNSCCCSASMSTLPDKKGCCHNEALPFQTVTETLPETCTFSFDASSVQLLPEVGTKSVQPWSTSAAADLSFAPAPPPPCLSGKGRRLACCSLTFYA